MEEYVNPREIWVALLGTGELEVLPLVEQDFGDREMRLVTWEAKHVAGAGPQTICPAQIGSKLTVLRDIRLRPSGPASAGITPVSASGSTALASALFWRSTPCQRSVCPALMFWPRGPPDRACRACSIASSISPTRGILDSAPPRPNTLSGRVWLLTPIYFGRSTDDPR